MQTTVSIPGIHCNSCAVLIKDVSQDFPSIQHIDVDLAKKTVTLKHDGRFDLASWSHALEEVNPAYKAHTLSQTQ